MELVDGRPLSGLIADSRLSAGRVLHLGIQITAALAHAHEHGVVHGDLKGHNVLVTPQGGVKLLDFGLARSLEPASVESMTRQASGNPFNGAIAGTVPFMAPETLRGAPLTPAADVWALGVLLHEMACGARPFVGANTYEVAAAILHDAPRPLPASVPPPLATVICRCLEKSLAQRYTSAREPLAALELLIAGGRGPAATPSPGRRMHGWRVVTAGIMLAVLAGLGWRWTRAPSPGPPTPPQVSSLIVLPFDNLSRDANDDYFADGMTEALITDLSRIPTLTVISRTSSIRYKALRKSSRELADELHVGAIVDGSILRSAGQVRITVRLVDAASDRILWGRDYTRELRDILALQGDVARAIASEIRASFAPADESRFVNAAPVVPEANEEFLKGRYHWNRRTADGLQQAIAHYRRAVALQPSHAGAYAGLAQCYVVLPAFPISTMPWAEAMPLATEAAQRALALDDRLADAHAALAYARLNAWDFVAAEDGFRRALAINPGNATAHFWYAAALASVRRFDESIDQARQGAALDPVSPIITSGVAWMYHLARRFDEEVESAKAALALEPNFMMARYRLGAGYLHLGRLDDALAEWKKAQVLSQDSADLLAAVAYAHARTGHRREALAELRTLMELSASGKRYVSPYALALVHVGLGNRDEAFSWLARAVDIKAGHGVSRRRTGLRCPAGRSAVCRAVGTNRIVASSTQTEPRPSSISGTSRATRAPRDRTRGCSRP